MLFTAGAHVPVTAFVEVVGNANKLAPEQIAATCVNIGVILAVTVIVIVAVLLQLLSVGVKV